jgi:hypothetical protein
MSIGDIVVIEERSLPTLIHPAFEVSEIIISRIQSDLKYLCALYILFQDVNNWRINVWINYFGQDFLTPTNPCLNICLLPHHRPWFRTFACVTLIKATPWLDVLSKQ